MCQSEEDEALWHDDPQEYIRIKYGNHLLSRLWRNTELALVQYKRDKKISLFLLFVTEALQLCSFYLFLNFVNIIAQISLFKVDI